jgi:hypothetical protein
MASVIKVLGSEQTFTVANTFSPDVSTAVGGWNVVRVLNTATVVGVITINSTPSANITIAGGGELIIEKAANTTMTGSAATLLGVSIAFKNN